MFQYAELSPTQATQLLKTLLRNCRENECAVINIIQYKQVPDARCSELAVSLHKNCVFVQLVMASTAWSLSPVNLSVFTSLINICESQNAVHCCKLSFFFISFGQRCSILSRQYTDAKVSVLLHGAMSITALTREPTLCSATGSQTQVPTLTLTWKTSHFLFCSDSKHIFLLIREENHSLEQDFDSAAAIVFMLLYPGGCGIVEWVEGKMELTQEEQVTVDILGQLPFPQHDGNCCHLPPSQIHRRMCMYSQSKQ